MWLKIHLVFNECFICYKGTVTTLTEKEIRTEDSDTFRWKSNLYCKTKIVGGKLFIDNNGNNSYDEGYDSLLGPEK